MRKSSHKIIKTSFSKILSKRELPINRKRVEVPTKRYRKENETTKERTIFTLRHYSMSQNLILLYQKDQQQGSAPVLGQVLIS
ncbi:hypothetical protein LFX25_14220 [Leptospira sp. FAT2]|uniref:hypothetical protein n=1 Tax=Leptospira sanjuanensis TaxID=2879643 RepID=UPI001EE7E010|nr:hypothetical protein [Leptospira sanjuanensis]MCG6194400.1 hypothetical protein [Leptospira sanjuanensis]